jgi:hypothetical protein
MMTNGGIANYAAQTMPYMATAPYMMGGVQYNQMPNVQPTTGLSKQEIEELKKNGNGAFRLNITPEEMKRARCCHRDGNTNFLVPTNNPDKPFEKRCTLCGEVFNLLEDLTPQMVTNHVHDTHDLMNTIKVLYVDLPPKLINEIFQIIPVMDKMGSLFSIAADRFQTYYGNTNQYASQVNPFTPNGFQTYNNMMTGQMVNPYATAAQPVMNPQFGTPAQPMMNPQYGMPAQQMGNPQYGMPAQPMMNPMQQQMTAAAPGLSNGFGLTEPPQTAVQPGATPAADNQQHVVTKQLQA